MRDLIYTDNIGLNTTKCRRRRRSEVTSAGQCLYAGILQFQHTITNTNTNI